MATNKDESSDKTSDRTLSGLSSLLKFDNTAKSFRGFKRKVVSYAGLKGWKDELTKGVKKKGAVSATAGGDSESKEDAEGTPGGAGTSSSGSAMEYCEKSWAKNELGRDTLLLVTTGITADYIEDNELLATGWRLIVNKFEGLDANEEGVVKGLIADLVLEYYGDPDVYIQEVKNLGKRLKACGDEYYSLEKNQVFKILNGLPKSWSTYKTNILMINGGKYGDVPLEDIESTAGGYYKRILKGEIEGVDAPKVGDDGLVLNVHMGGSSGMGSGNFKGKCYGCQEYGHARQDCPNKDKKGYRPYKSKGGGGSGGYKKGGTFKGKCHGCHKYGHMKRDCEKSSTEDDEAAVGFLFAMNGHGKGSGDEMFPRVKADRKISLVDDGGCNTFIVRQKELLSDFVDEKRRIEVGKSGVFIESKGKGTLAMNCVDNDGKVKLFTFTDVFCIPEAVGDFMPTKVLARKGMKFHIDDTGTVMKCGTSLFKLKHHAKSGLDVLEGVVIMPRKAAGSLYAGLLKKKATRSMSYEDYHARGAHGTTKNLQATAKLDGLTLTGPEVKDCHACEMAKLTRTTPKRLAAGKYKAGEKTLFDQSGPTKFTGIGGMKYVNLVKDAATSRGTLFGMGSKKQTAKSIRKLC